MKKSVLGLVFILVLAASCRVPPPSQKSEPAALSVASASPRLGDADFPTPSPSERHTEKVAAVRSGHYDLVLIGDSITQTLGELGGKYEPLRAVWDRHFGPRRAINLGYNGYRTEQILWNLQNGELDFAESPKVAIVLIGTNNSDERHFAKVHSAEEILAGTKAIVELIHKRHPTTKILVLRIFPRGGDAEKGASPPAFNSSAQCITTCRRAGELTSRLADGKQVFWRDVNYVFLRPDGTINTELMWDLLHPSPAGAEAWAQAIEPTLAQLMGDQPLAVEAPWTLQTRYARLTIDGKGFITSLKSVASKREYCPPGRPSPLLSLYVHATKESMLPVSARFRPAKQEAELIFPNGATALVSVSAKEKYFRFQLVALSGRGEADNAVWGPLRTTVHQKIGDLIGVVRDDDWAVGMLGLDDNTIAGPPVDGDCYGMGYYIHSPNPVKYPVPAPYKEGQWFNIGGDGISDTAFYSHPEEYFQQVFGTGARLEPEFGSSLAYHARDRRKSYLHLFSLLPGFPRSRPRHQESDPVERVDFIGSGVALYACPDDLGLATIESILLAEGLPHIVIDGKWIRDPSAFQPALFWRGPHDKCLEYAAALGFKDISKDTAEFYPSLDRQWTGTVGFSGGRTVSYREFAEEAARQGMTHGGLHTLTVFLQGGISHDVTPVPSERLQGVCHTTLARDISATDTEIVVTDPSFLAEKGTWPQGDDSNYLRIGGEMLRYAGISAAAPWTLQGVKRGHASQAQAHQAGDRLVKLQQNCYNGFVPDMKLLLEYADFYAELMARNRMSSIGFDGLESTVYQNHGYYAVRVFMRRLFETYHRLTGQYPRVTGSNVFAGAWEYMDACNVGGGDNMFNAATGRWGIEGKDIRNGYENSYYPGTFGLQDWHSDWSVYDLENLQAKAIGWDATYGLGVGQEAIEQSGEKEAMLKAFRAWQNARAAKVFPRKEKELLRDPEHKFHLEQTGERGFLLRPIREIQVKDEADAAAKRFAIRNPYGSQPLELALRVQGPAAGCVLTLPDGSQLKCEQPMEPGQFIVCRGEHAFLADKYRRKKADLSVGQPAVLPRGDSAVTVQLPNANPTARTHFELTVWASGKNQKLR